MADKKTRISSRTELRIVSVKKGSWKWQDAYAIVKYKQVRSKDGRILWKSAGAIAGASKISMPCLKREFPEFANLKHGSLHNQER